MQYPIEQLIRLAQNPFYKMSQDQLEQLEAYNQQVLHDTTIEKHDTTVQKHDPKPKEGKKWKKN